MIPNHSTRREHSNDSHPYPPVPKNRFGHATQILSPEPGVSDAIRDAYEDALQYGYDNTLAVFAFNHVDLDEHVMDGVSATADGTLQLDARRLGALEIQMPRGELLAAVKSDDPTDDELVAAFRELVDVTFVEPRESEDAGAEDAR